MILETMKVFSLLDIADLNPTNGVSPSDCAYYLLADSALVGNNKPLFLPEWDDDFRAQPCVVFRIGKLGKCIAECFAERYFDGIAAGFTVRGCATLKRLEESGRPMASALSFDGAAAVGEWSRPADMMSGEGIEISFKFAEVASLSGAEEAEGGELFEISPSKSELFELGAKFLSAVSERNKMQTGDLLFLPLSRALIGLKVGMNIETSLKNPASGKEIRLNSRIR